MHKAKKSDAKKIINQLKKQFSKRLGLSSEKRISTQPKRHLRLQDSIARLFELNSVCAAIAIHNNHIIIGLNTVHAGSRATNQYIRALQKTRQLLMQKNPTIDSVIDKLSDIITINFQSAEYNLVNRNGYPYNQIHGYIVELLEDLFRSGLSAMEWREDCAGSALFRDLVKRSQNRLLITKLVEKVARLSRDYLKVHNFITRGPKNNDEKVLHQALTQSSYKLLKAGKVNVHAEMRVSAYLAKEKALKGTYIGISKLCCAHCGLAIDAIDAQVRGKHGQSYNWPIPDFLKSSQYLPSFLGADLHKKYVASDKKSEIDKHIQNRKSSPYVGENKQQGRRMDPDTSDSDTDFGIELNSDDENYDRYEDCLTHSTLIQVVALRELKAQYSYEIDILLSAGADLDELVTSYLSTNDEFNTFISDDFLRIIEQEKDNQTIFAKLSQLYRDDEPAFFDLLCDEDSLIADYGFDDVYDNYQAILSSPEQYDEDDYDEDYNDNGIYAIVSANYAKENGWDLTENSSDSENRWRSADDDLTTYHNGDWDTAVEDEQIDSDEFDEIYQRFRY